MAPQCSSVPSDSISFNAFPTQPDWNIEILRLNIHEAGCSSIADDPNARICGTLGRTILSA